MKKYLLFFLLLSSNILSFAQNTSSKSTNWSEYYSFHGNSEIAIATDRIYSANPNAIFYLQKSDNTIHHLSKNNGLSDVGITAIASDPTGNYLIVGYDNGNIDIINNNQTTNIVDLKSKLLSSKKTINNITFLSKKAFLATSFGVVVLDYEKAQLEDTYILSSIGESIRVNKLFADTVTNNLYAATVKGVFYATFGQSNLADFKNWTKIAAFENTNCNALSYFDGTLYINAEYYNPVKEISTDSLYIFKNGKKNLFKKQYIGLHNIHVCNDKLLIISRFEINIYDKSLLLKLIIDSSVISPPILSDASLSKDNILWYIDAEKGLYNSTDNKPLCPGSPYSDAISSIRSLNDFILISHGIPWKYKISGLSYYNPSTYQWLYTIDWGGGIPINSANNSNELYHFYVGTMDTGIIEYNGIGIPTKTFNTTNSNINGNFISDIAIDSANNLFVYSARNVEYPFSAYTKQGKWFKWNYSDFTRISDQSTLLIDKNNWKWVVANDGIFVFNDKNTLDNIKDDDTKFISLIDNTGESFSSSALSMAIDMNNVLWVGTQSGLAYYSNSNQIFGDSKPVLSRNKVTVNGVVDYLLASENITSIAIDAANRKWIGTNSGLFLVSSNGTEVLQHFTIDNSPLPSNAISCLKVIPDRSELIIGTFSGLVSYNIGIKEAKNDFSEISIFPNPVKHDFTGLVKFEGLMENTTIKLLDINGNLVYETVSEGGTAFWDGKNIIGQRVASGVYIVILVNNDQTQKKISKIIFIH